MRLVQVLVGDDDRDDVLSLLDDEDVDYVVTAQDSGDGVVVQFPLPPQAVDYVLGRLDDAASLDDYRVVVSAESARTEHFDQLEQRFVEGSEEDDSIAHEEIRAKALGMNPNAVTYYSMTLLSALVATAGLLLDSPAIVVGSMVIAPQVGSALTASVGLVLGDRSMVSDGLRSQVFGLALAVLGAAAFGWLLKATRSVPPVLDVTTVNQISKRISPGVLSLTVGVSAGAAGAFGLATALPVSLVGVMIAAALIPAAAAVGVGLAWGYASVALGAFVLLVVNTVSINVAAVAVLRYLGYRPASDGGIRTSLPFDRAGAVLAATLVVLGAVAGGALWQHVGFENEVNQAAQDVLDDPEYRSLELVSVRTQFQNGRPGDAQEVTVVLNRPADESYPDLARALGDRVTDRTGRLVAVEIQFVDRVRYEPA
ncbi:TIGR00341 family protein [Halobacteriaceae archaeon GCM10025711]